MFEQIVSGLVARGIPEHIAIGMAMRMNAESGLNPGINEIKPLVPGSRGGYGLNQWTGPRRVAYEAYADARGLPYDDLNAQLDFTKHELETTEKGAWETLQGAKTPEEAARVYMEKFLRPGIVHADMRGGAKFNPPSNFHTPETAPKQPLPEMTWGEKIGLLGEAMADMQPQPQAPQLMPVSRGGYTPVKRDPMAIYRQLLGGMT